MPLFPNAYLAVLDACTLFVGRRGPRAAKAARACGVGGVGGLPCSEILGLLHGGRP